MARQPRFVVPGIAQHVIQRGNNRSATFCDALDYHLFLEFLRDACQEHECSVHAYVLMTNHVHLLMTPQHEWGISKVMQCVGRRYVGHYNKRMARTGGLWEGRYRASLIDTETYLFRCMRYIELNPVRACMVAHPRDYRWSSYHANARGYSDVLVTPHQRVEHVVDADAEGCSDAERDLERRRVLVALDRIDGLARHADLVRENLLRHLTGLVSQCLDAVADHQTPRR